jgi:hypothetical protein
MSYHAFMNWLDHELRDFLACAALAVLLVSLFGRRRMGRPRLPPPTRDLLR